MKRPLWLLCITTLTCTGHEFSGLQGQLAAIDQLETYGPPTSLFGLDVYVQSILNGIHGTHQQRKAALTAAKQLMAKPVYRDNKQRSRIYHMVQQRLIAQLSKTDVGCSVLRSLSLSLDY